MNTYSGIVNHSVYTGYVVTLVLAYFPASKMKFFSITNIILVIKCNMVFISPLSCRNCGHQNLTQLFCIMEKKPHEFKFQLYVYYRDKNEFIKIYTLTTFKYRYSSKFLNLYYIQFKVKSRQSYSRATCPLKESRIMASVDRKMRLFWDSSILTRFSKNSS